MINYVKNGNCTLVLIRITVLGGREERECEGGVVGGVLVPVASHLNLVASDDELECIGVEEPHGLISTIVVRTRSHLIWLPIIVVLIDRVAPQ